MQRWSRSFVCLSTVSVRVAIVLGLSAGIVACEQPKKKVVPAADSGGQVDASSDADDTGGADTGGGGDVTEDTSTEVGDATEDTGTPATCDEQLGLLPSTECGCGGQLICRDQTAAPVCVGALPENACGGCGTFSAEIGSNCGFCGDGVWTCDEANPDVPSCVGETPQNSCGGCGTLPGIEGDSCSSTGFFLCITEDDLACVGPGQNACGGFTALGDALGGPCGECGAGRFICDGTDAVRCEEAAEPRNACGGCGTLPNRVGDGCGDCGGTWQCDPDNPDGLVCSQTRNVCGTCGSPGSGTLGASCTGGRLVCGADGQLSCESNDRNLCGGTAALDAEPGSSCGACGGFNICASPDRVACIGSSPVNACGGCGFLPGLPGGFCGVDHTWECNPDGTMTCQQTSSSLVVSETIGGTTQVDQGRVSVPTGAVTDPIRITIRVRNGMMIPGYQLTSPVLEFGPAGTEFAQPLEVQIISDDAPASDMLWSNRPAEGGGYSEVPGATVQGDALVGDVTHFSLGFAGIPIPDAELCGDGRDNDGDGLSDCDDSDCSVVPGCLPVGVEACANGLDDDSDLLVDCEDSDCVGELVCQSPGAEVCDDGADNDRDGLSDCADILDCTAFPSCVETDCTNGADDDGDLLTDCLDRDCVDEPSCLEVSFEDCTDGIDNDGDRLSDCDDTDCATAPACAPPPAEVCTDGIDNDGNGFRDCLDSACFAAAACGGGGTEICDNGSDDDSDRLTDCADPDCARSAACATPPEDCLNGVDDDGDGLVDCADLDTCVFGTIYWGCSTPLEDCANGLDDDRNGQTDCLDSSCLTASTCLPSVERCADGIDNDGDGLVDCDDVATCAAAVACGADPSGSCVAPFVIDGSGYFRGTMVSDTDHTSGTCGGAGAPDDVWTFVAPSTGTWCVESFATADQYLYVRTDCTGGPSLDCRYGYFGSNVEFTATAGTTYFVTIDSYYGGFDYWLRSKPGSCSQRETACDDGADNDADGASDCADVDCGRDAACTELSCADGLDSDADGATDCADSDCSSDPACVEAVCGDFTDNDADGTTDCADLDCAGSVDCQELCDDGIDNDGDTKVDCYDPSCRGAAACPAQRCAGPATSAYNAGNGFYYAGFGTSMTGCAPGEGCSLSTPPMPFTLSGALVPVYEGICAPRLADGAACTGEPSDGYCETSVSGGAGCIEGSCRREGTYCDAGQSPGWKVDFLGNYQAYCLPTSMIAASGGACGDSVGAYCGRSDERCSDRTDLHTTNDAGICLRRVTYPSECPVGTRYSFEWTTAGTRNGLCLPVVGDGASCDLTSRCDETQNLVCGTGGSCRPVAQAEACNTPHPLESNPSAIGPDLFAVDRLDGLTAADESLNCSGTVGPEKVYFYTAVAPVELSVEAGTLDGNGPKISWYARKGTCTDIFSEVACGSASLSPSSGKLQVAAGETVYLIVDSEVRWSGGDNAAAEFFIALTETPVVQAGESCVAAACAEGLRCGASGFCGAPACGDGLVDVGESCDDANAIGGDGCSACQIDVFAEVEPNSDLASANQVGQARRVTGNSYYDADFFCVDVGPEGGRVGIRNIEVSGNCSLYSDLLGPLPCGTFREFTVWSSQACFSVVAYNGLDYAFDIRVDPFELLTAGEACGPTAVTGSACADISGAPAVCQETSPRLNSGICAATSCGDGYLDRTSGEGCDDGNTISGDACSSTCQLESYAEIEPNNGTLTARSLGAYRKVTGTLASTSDYDYFKVTLTKRSHLEFKVESTTLAAYSGSVGIQLLSSTAAVLYSGTMDPASGKSGARGGYLAGGGGYMERVQALAFVEPGTYTLRLSAANVATGDYTFFVREIPTSDVAVGGQCDPASYKPCRDGLACSVISNTCREPVCGDGDVTVGEACDDGDLTSGDGCSATCQVEAFDADSLSTGSQSVSRIDGGTIYTFADGSTARVIAIAGSWSLTNIRFVALEVNDPTRIRVYNVNRPYSQFRIWRYGQSSPYSSEGTQVIGIDGSSVPYPAWFAATTATVPTSVECDTSGADGLCTSIGGGVDCMDCGARYAGSPTAASGFDTRLAPGTYIVEFSAYDTGNPTWIFLGESPAENSRFR